MRLSYKNGTRYGNRTRLTNVKGWCPKPIDEPSKKDCKHTQQGYTQLSLSRRPFKPIGWHAYKNLVRKERLELSILAALASKTRVYTIPPLTHWYEWRDLNPQSLAGDRF